VRQRAESDTSSFYLLLDMMCNAFGGIVFIGLLIAILSSSMSRQDAEKKSNSSRNLDKVEQKLEAERLAREQQELTAAQRHLEETLRKIKGPSGASPATDLASLICSNGLLQSACDALAASNSLISVSIFDSETSIELNSTSAADVEKQITRLRADLLQKQEASKETLRLPREHPVTGKNAAFIGIKDGKLYAISNVSGSRPRNYDREDVDVESGPGRDVVELRKNRGQFIKRGCEDEGKFAQALASLNSHYEFVSFAVSTNSFAEFNYVKAIFVGHGFLYNWVVTEGAIEIVVQDEPLRVQ